MESSPVGQVASIMQSLDVWWAVAGGWAIDLWLDRQTRVHHDVEVVVRRSDQQAVWVALHDGWGLLCLDPPDSVWRQWRRGHEIVPPSFQLKARAAFVEFDLFLESTRDDDWCFRRDARVHRPLHEIVSVRSGWPIVTADVNLLYMANSEDPKNQHDFELTWPTLDEASSVWLRDSLALIHPGHRWLDVL